MNDLSPQMFTHLPTLLLFCFNVAMWRMLVENDNYHNFVSYHKQLKPMKTHRTKPVNNQANLFTF